MGHRGLSGSTCICMYNINIPYKQLQYIWRTISLVNSDVMHIGVHFSLGNIVILSVHCFIMLHIA